MCVCDGQVGRRDLDSSISTAQSQRIPYLAGAVLVTTPQAVATADVRKEINFCAKTQIPVLGVIENLSGYTCPCCGEVSNLFSRGGGEVMAKEMGVPFLGYVPIDIKFSALVEGARADDDEVNDDASAGEEKRPQREESAAEDTRPLVERYKDCWSLPIFEGFSRELIGKIEGERS